MSSQAVTSISTLFAAHGRSDYVGEAVCQLEHALQAAHHARRSGADEETVLAALLHDVGHMLGLQSPGSHGRMGDCGVLHHEHVGADWLAALGLPHKTTELVRLHVQAKRYLCWKTPAYMNKLSPASVTTLGYQGGPMSDVEGAAFEAHPWKDTILAMRTWDEAAKVQGAQVPAIEEYYPVIDKLVR